MERTEKAQEIIWHGLPVLGLFLWGALCLTNNLWYDEAYSASLVSLPWERLIYITAVDAHSPFYYSLLKPIYHLFGGGTFFVSLKLFSLAFMMGYLMLGKYYVRKLFGRQISIYFMLFSLLMPIMSVQAGNVRMYAVAIFFMTLTGLTAYDIYLEASRKKWIIFCLASICTVYCHTFALIQTFLLYLLFLGALLYGKQYKKLKGFFLSGIAVSVVFSPWLVVTIWQLILRMRYDTGSAVNRPGISTFMEYCEEWFSAGETPIGPVVFLGMGLCIVLGYLAVDWMRSHNNFAPAIGMGALGLTALAGALIAVYVNNCFLGRYIFPGYGFLMLFYAVGMSQLRSVRLKAGILVVAVCCFLMQYSSELSLEYGNGLDAYEQYVEENFTEEDAIIGPYAHTLFLNVYHPELQYFICDYKHYSLPFVNTEVYWGMQQVSHVQGNFWYLCFASDSPEKVGDNFAYEEVLRFHHMYYDFVLYRLTPHTAI